jgi:hypothetical protein
MSEKTNRRNLSGVYIFHKFNDEESREPTCFEDCPDEKQSEWLNTLDPDAVKRLAIHLAKTLRSVGDQFGLVAGSKDE